MKFADVKSALLRISSLTIDDGGGVCGARGGRLDAQREQEEGAGQSAQKYLILRADLLRRASAHFWSRPGARPRHKKAAIGAF